jgi:mRNA-degrading endonuclease YafQ of YafQ-DinJ toxin-antitoxin module
MPPFQALVFTSEFLETYSELRPIEQRRIREALLRLDTNERHPSLRVHQLQGPLEGIWSASASDSLRITFERLPGGQKRVLECSRHHGD